jgi:hypothetical protein
MQPTDRNFVELPGQYQFLSFATIQQLPRFNVAPWMAGITGLARYFKGRGRIGMPNLK